MYLIDNVYKVPVEEISCPGCGKRYGHDNTKVCLECSECTSCCWCDEKDLVTSKYYIEEVIGYKPHR